MSMKDPGHMWKKKFKPPAACRLTEFPSRPAMALILSDLLTHSFLACCLTFHT